MLAQDFLLTSAFVASPGRWTGRTTARIDTLQDPFCRSSVSVVHATPNDRKKKGTGLDESVRTKLVSESIAPWRTLRLFLYFSLGSGALVGGLITLTGLTALLSGAKEGNVNTEVNCVLCPVEKEAYPLYSLHLPAT